jgi:putative ABC transport system permease protein
MSAVASPAAARGRPRIARPVDVRRGLHWRTMASLGLAMMLNDKAKLAGTLLGVVFAVVLTSQAGALFLGLLSKNTLLQNHGGADVWIAPAAAQQAIEGPTFSDSALYAARTTPGVEWAAPIVIGNATIKLPSGASDSIQIVGVEPPDFRGGPFNVVAGDPRRIAEEGTVTFDEGVRENFGGLNIGSIREVNGHRVTCVALTWGLLPFAPSYAFASLGTARELLRTDEHRVSFVLIRVRRGVDPRSVVETLRTRLPNQLVITNDDFRGRTEHYLIVEGSMGASFGSSTGFAIVVGFVIVSLTMFTAVVDHMKEYGTLKAIGATNGDLARLLLAQALIIALIGSALGEGLARLVVNGMRSAKLAVFLPPWLLASTVVLMVVLCSLASLIALARLRRLEPAIVFRG